jgi:hypothetical protein
MKVSIRRSLVAAAVALLALAIAHWYDAGVLAELERRNHYDYNTSAISYAMPVVHLITGLAAVAIVLAAFWSRTILASVGYVLVGGFLVFMEAMVEALNGRVALAPEPITTVLNQWFYTLATGVTGAVFTLGGVMFVTGLAVTGSILRTRHRNTVATPRLSTPALSVGTGTIRDASTGS